MIISRAVVTAAGLLAAPSALPVLPASSLVLTAPALSAPSVTPLIVPAGAPTPFTPAAKAEPDLELLVARGWIESGPWFIVLREGRNAHGQKIMTLDALDASAPQTGTVGHVDVTLQGAGSPAVLDGPLDPKTDPARLPPGAENADLSHWRPHLWFGFAVTPDRQGQGLGVLLLELASALCVREGAPQLIIYATESSRGFYLARFVGRVLGDEPFTGADESVYHRLVVKL